MSQANITYAFEVYVWSHLGDCPITHRQGACYDVLHHSVVQATDVYDAMSQTREIAKALPYKADMMYAGEVGNECPIGPRSKHFHKE